MSQQGRFGKYGDLKRKEKIRQNRLLRSGVKTTPPAARGKPAYKGPFNVFMKRREKP